MATAKITGMVVLCEQKKGGGRVERSSQPAQQNHTNPAAVAVAAVDDQVWRDEPTARQTTTQHKRERD